MDSISFFWLLVVTVLTVIIYFLINFFLYEKRQKALWMCISVSTFVYSGIGIAGNTVDKDNTFTYLIFLLILGLTYKAFVSLKLKLGKKSILLIRGGNTAYETSKDQQFWENPQTARIINALFMLYYIFRVASLIYPVNNLINFRIQFDSTNNLANINHENVSFLGSLAGLLRPFKYIGLFYCFKKIRHIFFVLLFDELITLINTGYLSRHNIVTVVIICFLAFVNSDLCNRYTSMSKKRRRIVMSLMAVLPALTYVMLVMMEQRISSGRSYSLSQMLLGEVSYPRYMKTIRNIAPIGGIRDFFLQLLDSFVPIIPTPSYTFDLNVTFSQIVTGIGSTVSYFSVILPGIVGESLLIFGGNFFWVHAIIIAFMLSMIYKVIGNNKQMTILWYYYLTCVLKVGRAGYEQLSQSIWLNYVILMATLLLIKLFINSTRGKAIGKNQ